MKVNWKTIVPVVAAGMVVIWLAGKLQSCGNSDKIIEALYQEVQATRQAELDKRMLNTKKLEAAQAATASVYQVKIDKMATDTNNRIAAMSWKSNDALRKANASSEEILVEKSKVETALVEMTIGRDCLIISAHTREKEITDERSKLKTEHEAALKIIQDKLDTCEKARKFALDEGGRKTWFTIGPAVLVHIRQSEVVVDYGVSIHIPIIIIKSPFKRF